MESSHFWPSVLRVALYKTFFFDFWFRLPNPKIYSQKFGTKSPISRLLWQIDLRCLGLLGGFLGWPIQWNHTKCCGDDPCCHGNDIWLGAGSNRLPACLSDCLSVKLRYCGFEVTWVGILRKYVQGWLAYRVIAACRTQHYGSLVDFSHADLFVRRRKNEHERMHFVIQVLCKCLSVCRNGKRRMCWL